MLLVLIRHGIAEEIDEVTPRPGEVTPRDEDRALTEQGRRRLDRSSLALKKIDIRAQVIAHSGLRRAAETAELLADRIADADTATVVTATLYPSAAPRDFFALLPQWEDAECVVAVGHAPHLDRLVALALGAQGRMVTSLGKAAAVALDVPTSGRPVGQLLWLLPPKMLRRLGR